MNRIDALRYRVNPGDRGIEIGPWNNPIAPKAEGYLTIAADVYDTDYLKERGLKDPSISNESLSRIEPVDVVLKQGLHDSVSPFLQKQCIHELGFIISSHNIEHLPDPLSFLIDCEKLLKPLGVLNLAIPIASRCFDAMREPTTCGRIIDSYDQRKKTPSFGDIIDQRTSAVFTKKGDEITAVEPNNVRVNDLVTRSNPLNTPSSDYRDKIFKRFGDSYVDTHVSTFNPYSFELIFNDLCAFGYMKNMRITSIRCNDDSQEFIVNIEKTEKPRDDFLSQESRLLLRKKSLEHKIRDMYFLNANTDVVREEEMLSFSEDRLSVSVSHETLGMRNSLVKALKELKKAMRR